MPIQNPAVNLILTNFQTVQWFKHLISLNTYTWLSEALFCV